MYKRLACKEELREGVKKVIGYDLLLIMNKAGKAF